MKKRVDTKRSSNSGVTPTAPNMISGRLTRATTRLRTQQGHHAAMPSAVSPARITGVSVVGKTNSPHGMSSLDSIVGIGTKDKKKQPPKFKIAGDLAIHSRGDPATAEAYVLKQVQIRVTPMSDEEVRQFTNPAPKPGVLTRSRAQQK